MSDAGLTCAQSRRRLPLAGTCTLQPSYIWYYYIVYVQVARAYHIARPDPWLEPGGGCQWERLAKELRASEGDDRLGAIDRGGSLKERCESRQR